jgi:hypothetical protein
MIAVSLDNLLFFLLIAVAALFQLLSKAMSKAGKSEPDETTESPTPQTPRPIRRAPTESDADRIRKFLEALGQPPTSTPPSPVAPRTDIAPRPLAPVQPPRVIPGAWRLPREQRQKPTVVQESFQPEQPSPVQQIIPPPVPVPGAAAFEVHEALPVDPQQPPVVKTPVELYAAPKPFGVAKWTDFKTDIATLLASKTGLREAIILREIFGPPRALQELEL